MGSRRDREPVWSHSLGDEPRYPFHEEALRAHIHGAVALPVIAGDEVLAVIAMSGPRIAAQLFVSPTTIKPHFEDIYVAYAVTDRVAAVAKAMREGLLS